VLLTRQVIAHPHRPNLPLELGLDSLHVEVVRVYLLLTGTLGLSFVALLIHEHADLMRRSLSRDVCLMVAESMIVAEKLSTSSGISSSAASNSCCVMKAALQKPGCSLCKRLQAVFFESQNMYTVVVSLPSGLRAKKPFSLKRLNTRPF
jgi:hypothetical protein